MWIKLKNWFQRLWATAHHDEPEQVIPKGEASKPIPEVSEKPTHIHPYDKAVTQLGIKEISGSKDTPDIVEYLKACGNIGGEKKTHHDEVPWCSAFLNWLADQCGCYKTDNALASSWDGYQGMRYHKGAMIPQGAIVRIAHPGGHVTLANKMFRWTGEGSFEGLGGNQGNEVCVANYHQADIVSIHYWAPKPKTILAAIASKSPGSSGTSGSTR